MLTTWQPDDIYLFDKLQYSLSRLDSLGYFWLRSFPLKPQDVATLKRSQTSASDCPSRRYAMIRSSYTWAARIATHQNLKPFVFFRRFPNSWSLSAWSSNPCNETWFSEYFWEVVGSAFSSLCSPESRGQMCSFRRRMQLWKGDASVASKTMLLRMPMGVVHSAGDLP